MQYMLSAIVSSRLLLFLWKWTKMKIMLKKQWRIIFIALSYPTRNCPMESCPTSWLQQVVPLRVGHGEFAMASWLRQVFPDQAKRVASEYQGETHFLSPLRWYCFMEGTKSMPILLDLVEWAEALKDR